MCRLRLPSELGTANRLTASYSHFGEDDIPDYGIPWYFNRPAPVARHNYYGFRDGNDPRTDVDMVALKVEHDISDWSFCATGPGLRIISAMRASPSRS